MITAVPRKPDPRARRPRAGPQVRSHGKRILYVDDEPVSSAGDESPAARRWCAICLLAGTHEQAVAIVEGEPDLALAILDFQMPDGDVDSLVKRLRTACAALPLIGTSGADRRQAFAERGVTGFLEKPWQLDTLVRNLNW
jgi:CheY-like chemotaxis protein